MIDEDAKMPFLGHLEELRKRLIACAIAAGAGFVISYIFADRLFQLLILPLKAQLPEGDKLIYTNLPEMFLTYLKSALVAGILISSPYIFYQLWMFIAPGLYHKERKYVLPFVIFSTILFVGGALFGYFVVFPFGFKFFLSFSNDSIQALPSVKQYFSFSIKLLFAFGVVFELPVIVFFLTKIGVVTPKLMRRKRKYAVLLTFMLAAILTPPDVFTQLMMAAPLLLLYEISIIVSKMAERKKVAEEEDAAKGSEG